MIDSSWLATLQAGQVIPACPLALSDQGSWEEHRQRALVRYYIESGSGGLAVAVHTTQFQIRDPKWDLLKPVLQLVSQELESLNPSKTKVRIAGVCGNTKQAVHEAELAYSLGYQVALLSLATWKQGCEEKILEHCRIVASIIPIMGFYLQPAVGGVNLSESFWSRFAEISNVVAIKIAPFDRYRTLDVIHGVAASGRRDIALYTGNDDSIVADLLTPFDPHSNTQPPTPLRIVGGLLGQWAVWTKKAVELHRYCRDLAMTGDPIPQSLLQTGARLTAANAVIFDASHHFHGCIPGINEVLHLQGLLSSNRCLDPNERLSPDQELCIRLIPKRYPDLIDDDFIAANLDRWLS